MKHSNCNREDKIVISISTTTGRCPAGEMAGERGIEEKKVPVLSCEGACIRGEIARLAANYVSKNSNFQRGCHGELFTVPDSKIARWIMNAEKVVCIDGCFLKCQSRILENIIGPERLKVFDALSHYNKYGDIFEMDDVPEEERKEVARDVARWVVKSIEENKPPVESSCCSGGC